MKKIFNKINRIDDLLDDKNYGDRFEIVLESKSEIDKINIGKKYAIEVKTYMTQPATATFNFQDEWNNGKPMPCTCMSGIVIKETRGMYYMKLEAPNEDLTWEGWVIKSSIINWEEM